MADVSKMLFSKVYPLLINKVERKGRTRQDAIDVTCWLTGYTEEQISALKIVMQRMEILLIMLHPGIQKATQ